MKKENLKRGNEISKQIDRFNSHLKNWEKATKVSSVTLKNDSEYFQNAAGDEHINFEVLQTLTVQTIKAKIAELETEFENL